MAVRWHLLLLLPSLLSVHAGRLAALIGSALQLRWFPSPRGLGGLGPGRPRRVAAPVAQQHSERSLEP